MSEANEHPNVNIHFSSSKSYRKSEFDMNRAKYYTNMCLDQMFLLECFYEVGRCAARAKHLVSHIHVIDFSRHILNGWP